MAYKDLNQLDRADGEAQSNNELTLKNTGDNLDLPNESFVRDADISRDGADLVLDGPDGTLIVESYFAGLESPALIAPNGATLTPELVNSFISSGNEYAQNATLNDVSPIGAVQEISGDATITRGDGSTEVLSIGSPVYQGDIIETDADSAINVTFVDESSFAVSEETRLAIDEYVFDPSSQGGTQNFSVLKGVFVYTSGLIGREDPDDVSIETPVGSIGIRGTIIAGDVDKGEITVVEGAIVLRDPSGQEMTLATQFETGRFLKGQGIQNLGQKSANDVVEKFSIVSNVAPTLFSSINDAAAESTPATDAPTEQRQPQQQNNVEQDGETFDADGATDQDGDSEVDGTIDETGASDGNRGEGTVEDGAALEQPNTDKGQMSADMASNHANKMGQAHGLMNTNNAINTSQVMNGDSTANMAMTLNNTLPDGQSILDAVKDAQKARQLAKVKAKLGIADGSINDLIDIISPDVLRDLTSKLTGAAPTSIRGIRGTPNEFFEAAEGSVWEYDFGREFIGDHGLELSLSTLNFLNSSAYVLSYDGFSGSISGSYDTTLSITFVDDFDAPGLAAGGELPFEIGVSATANSQSVNETYNFSLFNDDATLTPFEWDFLFGFNLSSQTLTSDPGINSTHTIGTAIGGVDDLKVFYKDGNDTIVLGDNGHAVTNSEINLGSGDNIVTLGAGATDNIIIGGNDNDRFIIVDADNKV
ncbi:MAG: FecR domain-containing protein, partial [Bdellovibrionales bacterium]